MTRTSWLRFSTPYLLDKLFDDDVNLLIDDPSVDTQDDGKLDEDVVTNSTF